MLDFLRERVYNMSMMKTEPTIVYCHGYASSPNTDKVKELRKNFSEVLAFPIDPDPDVSIPFLEEEIDYHLLDNINSEKGLVFVGTSLGAWYAGRLACLYGCPAVLINPYYSSAAKKIDVGLPKELGEKYDALGFSFPENTRFFLGTNDEVIDFSELVQKYPAIWTQWCPAGHRFNGPEFQQVIDYLKTL